MAFFPANFTLLQQIVLALFVLVTGLLAIFSLNVWALTLLSIRGRNKLPQPPQLTTWPKVSINLPLYNEKSVAGRLLTACTQMDYPRESLEIIVVDDSDDGTTEIVRGFERRFPGLVKVIHRSERTGFKAGALKEALRNSSGEFVTYFDADYVPPRDFLKQMIPFLFVNPKVGFVQARWSYLDGQFSWLARAISLGIDIYAFVDQRARYVGNLLAHFSGSCGVFRKEAILDAGGWHEDTLAEDLDLSIRLHLKGWKYVYVPTVVCPGEIPPTFDTLKSQQFRWAKGFSQCLRKHGMSILRSKALSAFQKVEAILHLCTYFLAPVSIMALVAAVMYYAVFPLSFWLWDWWRYTVMVVTFMLSLTIYTAPLAASSVTISEIKSSFRRVFHLGYLGAVLYKLLLSNTRAVVEGLIGTPSYFYRTPRVGYGAGTLEKQ